MGSAGCAPPLRSCRKRNLRVGVWGRGRAQGWWRGTRGWLKGGGKRGRGRSGIWQSYQVSTLVIALGCMTLQEAQSLGETGQLSPARAPRAGAQRNGAAATARTSQRLGSWGRGRGGEDQAGLLPSVSSGRRVYRSFANSPPHLSGGRKAWKGEGPSCENAPSSLVLHFLKI